MGTTNKRLELIIAIGNQDLDLVISLVNQLDELNFTVSNKNKYQTPLIMSLISVKSNYDAQQTANYLKIIKYLLDHGSDPNYQFYNNYEVKYSLTTLLKHHDIDVTVLFEVISILIKYGVNIDPNSDISSLEHYLLAIKIRHQGNRFNPTLNPFINYPDHQNIINLLLDSGVYPNNSVMNYLIEEQVSLNAQIAHFETYRTGKIELLEAIKNLNMELVDVNLKVVKNPNFVIFYSQFINPHYQISPLYLSIDTYFQVHNDDILKNKAIQIIKYLLENGCDPNYCVNSTNILTRTIIDFNEDLEIIEIIVSYGSHINPKYAYDETPLIASINKRYDKTILYLLDHGADPKYSIDDAIRIDEKYIDLLVKYGAKLEDFMISKIQQENIEDVNILVKHGANVNQISNNTTALITAINIRSYTITKLLIDNGADVNLSVNGNSPILELSKQMYRSSYQLNDLIELIVKHPKFNPILNQILFDDDIDLLDSSKYIKSLLDQKTQFEQFALTINNIKYKNFTTNDPKLVDLLNSWNPFKIITISDIDETIQLLKNIIGVKIGSNRKEMIKNYYKLYPHGIDDGFRISDDQILNHIKYWNVVKSKLGTSRIENTILNKLEHDSHLFKTVQILFNDISKVKDNIIQTDIPNMNLFKIIDIYQISIPVQDIMWNQRTDKTESILLWHGTDRSNLLSILRTGFTIINQIFDPIEPKITGKAFGDGIYFADLAYKSMFYSDNLRNECHKPRSSGTGWLFLADVDLGNTFNAVTNGDYINSTSQHHSITANASVYSFLKYNEYVIKTPHINRINPRYLLHIKCNI